MTVVGVPYCNTSSSVRQTEELVAQLITETRSQLKCDCVEACSKVFSSCLLFLTWSNCLCFFLHCMATFPLIPGCLHVRK